MSGSKLQLKVGVWREEKLYNYDVILHRYSFNFKSELKVGFSNINSNYFNWFQNLINPIYKY